MEMSGQKNSRQPRVMLVGRGYTAEISLRVSLSRLDIDVLPSSSGSLSETVLEQSPDLIVCLGDEAVDNGAGFVSRLVSHASTALVPVVVLSKEAVKHAAGKDFRYGVIAHVYESDEIDEVAANLAKIAKDYDQRTGIESGVVSSDEAKVQILIDRLKGRPGLLRLVSAGESIGWELVSDQAARAQDTDGIRSAISAADSSGTDLEYEFSEWGFGRLHRCEQEGDSPVFDERALRGLRVVLIDDDPSRAKALADQLKRHYALVAVRPPEIGINTDPDLDPECVILSGANTHHETYRALRGFRTDPRLRWMDIYLVDWPAGTDVEEVSFGRLAACIERGSASAQDLLAKLEDREEVRIRVDRFGPRRAFRLVSQAQGVWALTLQASSGLVEVNVTEGLIVGAWLADRRGDVSRADGIEALAEALVLDRGVLRIRPITEPHVANIMGPVEETCDDALSSKTTRTPAGEPGVNPKATLLGVAPPAQLGAAPSGLDEPFGGVTMATPSLSESDVAVEKASSSDLPIQIDSAPPGLELESLVPAEPGPPPPPPPPPAAADADTTQQVPALSDTDLGSFDEELNTQDVEALMQPDDVDEEMPTQAIPSMIDLAPTEALPAIADDEQDMPTQALPSVADLAGESQDEMEKLASAARAEADEKLGGEEKLDRHSAYPTMRAPALADVPEAAESTLDAPQIAPDAGNSDENPEFATVRFSALDMEQLGLEPDAKPEEDPDDEPLQAPVIAPVAEEPKVIGAPPPTVNESEGSSSKGLIFGLVALLAVGAGVGAVMLGGTEPTSPDTSASSSETSANAARTVEQPEVPVVQDAVDAQAQEAAVAAADVVASPDATLPEPDASAPDAEPAEPDASAPDAEAVVEAVPDAEPPAAEAEPTAVAEAEPAPSTPAPAPAAPTGETVPTPDSLPECARGIRRSQRASRARSTEALRDLDNGDNAAAAEALAISICGDRRNPHAAIGYARLALARNQAATAVIWAQQACDLRGRRDEYRIVLGDALRAAGQPDQARAAYQEALRLNRRNQDAFARLAAMGD